MMAYQPKGPLSRELFDEPLRLARLAYTFENDREVRDRAYAQYLALYREREAIKPYARKKAR